MVNRPGRTHKIARITFLANDDVFYSIKSYDGPKEQCSHQAPSLEQLAEACYRENRFGPYDSFHTIVKLGVHSSLMTVQTPSGRDIMGPLSHDEMHSFLVHYARLDRDFVSP